MVTQPFPQGKQILEHNALLAQVPSSLFVSGHLFGAERESRPEYLPDSTNPAQNSL